MMEVILTLYYLNVNLHRTRIAMAQNVATVHTVLKVVGVKLLHPVLPL